MSDPDTKTHPTDEERKKLENDLLPIVGMLPFLERGRTLNPEMYPELVGYILNNFVPKAQATPKPAVLGDGELLKQVWQAVKWIVIDLRSTPGITSETFPQKALDDFIDNKCAEIMQLFASQATAAQERAEHYFMRWENTLKEKGVCACGKILGPDQLEGHIRWQLASLPQVGKEQE